MAPPSSLSKVSTPTSISRSNKQSKPSKMVRFMLSPTVLARFPHELVARKATQIKSMAKTTTTPAAPIKPISSTESKSESNTTPSVATPLQAGNTQDPTTATKVEAASLHKAGVKRPLDTAAEGLPKPKARPGPKKKARLDNGMIDNSDSANKGTGTSAPTHKLGPKANQGAINAGLRALDRTGKPCRKWQKTGFRVKSFIGTTWEIPSWKTTKKLHAVDGDTENASVPTSNSEGKANISSSNVDSEKSHNDERAIRNTASSPPALPKQESIMT